jgi:hypothetical protein
MKENTPVKLIAAAMLIPAISIGAGAGISYAIYKDKPEYLTDNTKLKTQMALGSLYGFGASIVALAFAVPLIMYSEKFEVDDVDTMIETLQTIRNPMYRRANNNRNPPMPPRQEVAPPLPPPQQVAPPIVRRQEAPARNTRSGMQNLHDLGPALGWLIF